MSEVAVTGLGAVTPLGVGAEELNRRWASGVTGISDGLGRCDEFEPADFLSVKELRRSDRCTQLATVAADEALRAAGWIDDGLPYPSERIGCVIATGVGGMTSFEVAYDILRDDGPDRVPPLTIPLIMPNAAAAAIAMRHGLQGECYGVVSACAASAAAIGTAYRLIHCGDLDAVVVGGTESAIGSLAVAAFANMGATSPCGISRPFDVERDGFVLGEGAAAIVLESAGAARRRGAPLAGRLLGYGASCDAYHLTMPGREGRQAARAIRTALADAELRPDDVDYVNAHGTSTPLNDRSETSAIKSALGEHAYKIPISSTKSTTGHLLGASAAVETVATLLALRDGVAPPTLGLETPEEGLDLDYVPHTARPIPNGRGERIALNNSFGFGGHNSVMVLAT
ncbi:MAG TPA: beta-ketoacyl-[acyl-carrier-protein] synthase family protein [Solirubrobacteraceae bacterium]|nr:beta-ketoacyl-[acyl-carrier-protein] synthase family protein [Solirubrobacteraceae bacterium]